MKARIADYNRISNMVMKQRELIARSTSWTEVIYNVTMAAGFLNGLALTGVILFSDVETYMKDLRTLANERSMELNGQKLSGNYATCDITSVHCQV